jgi:lipoprotein-anchoring transpeptidase ErfK/SrfK
MSLNNFAAKSLLLLPLVCLCAGAHAQNTDALAQPALDPAVDIAATTIAPEKRDVLRAQVLLDRAHFSSGEIDGRAGGNLKQALAGFQRSRGIDDDGRLGPDTWAELERDAVPTLVEYTLTEADVKGPFEELPKDMLERAALPALGYTAIDEALGERFHASPALLRKLNPGKQLDLAGEVILVPNVSDASAPTAATQVIVDRSERTLMLADAEGTVIAQFPASTGSKHDPLPVGDWKVDSVSVNPIFYYNPALFWDADPTHGKAELKPGPNNPVGLVWIDLSKEHYGIHGTPEPSRVGKTESHGCIRVTNWTAMLLSQAVNNDMPVLLRE